MTTIDEQDTVAALDSLLREWLADPAAILIAGRWGEGIVAEFLPRGKARLSPAGYGGKFAGLRDLRIEGEAHHMHLDLAKFRGVRYTIRPSVCYGWRPSLEIDLVGEAETPCFGLSAGHLYRGEELQQSVAGAYFARLFAHRRRYGELVEVLVRPSRAPLQDVADDWLAVADCCRELFPNGVLAEFDREDPIGSLSASLRRALAEVDRER